MMQSRYNVLQSGFISTENPMLATPGTKESDIEFDAYILNKPQKDNSNLFFYHKGIEQVYSEYNKNQRLAASFEFQEKAILAFMNALGSLNFATWCALQNDNPFLSDMHVRFIKDTAGFIAGLGRQVQPESWMLILDRNNSFSKTIGQKIDIATIFRSQKYGAFVPYPAKLDDPLNIPVETALLLNQWFSRPQGFADFMVTSKIIFGKQSTQKTANVA